MITLKFGGTSMGDAGRILDSADIMISRLEQDSISVIVSAVAGVSNRLQDSIEGSLASGQAETYVSDIEAIHQKICRELTERLPGFNGDTVFAGLHNTFAEYRRLLDAVAAFGECPPSVHCRIMGVGELLCAPIVEAVLKAKGCDVILLGCIEFCDGFKSGIRVVQSGGIISGLRLNHSLDVSVDDYSGVVGHYQHLCSSIDGSVDGECRRGHDGGSSGSECGCDTLSDVEVSDDPNSFELSGVGGSESIGLDVAGDGQDVGRLPDSDTGVSESETDSSDVLHDDGTGCGICEIIVNGRTAGGDGDGCSLSDGSCVGERSVPHEVDCVGAIAGRGSRDGSVGLDVQGSVYVDVESGEIEVSTGSDGQSNSSRNCEVRGQILVGGDGVVAVEGVSELELSALGSECSIQSNVVDAGAGVDVDYTRTLFGDGECPGSIVGDPSVEVQGSSHLGAGD